MEPISKVKLAMLFECLNLKNSQSNTEQLPRNSTTRKQIFFTQGREIILVSLWSFSIFCLFM